MNLVTKAKKMLAYDEGQRRFPYDDATGKPVVAEKGHITIGVGRNLQAHPLSDDEIDLILKNDIDRSLDAAHDIFLDFNHIDEVRQLAIINMLFNLGETKFRKFSQMIDAIHEREWERAALEAKNSLWFEQVRSRGERVVFMLRTGMSPYDSI